MAAVYFGRFSVSGSVPGLSAGFEKIGEALEDLRATASDALTTVQSARQTIDAQITLLGAAKTAIRIPAAADLDAQLTATLQIAAGLSLQASDPATYLTQLTAGVAQVTARLGQLVPSVALSAQATASAAIAASLEAKIAAIDTELAALTTISASLSTIVSALATVQTALTAVLAATLEAAGDYVALSAQLEADGVHCLLYTGPLSGLGAAIDAAVPGTGISGGIPVRVPVVLVEDSNTSGVSGVNSVFRVG